VKILDSLMGIIYFSSIVYPPTFGDEDRSGVLKEIPEKKLKYSIVDYKHPHWYALRLGAQSQYCLPDSPMAGGRIDRVSMRQRERDNPRYCNGLGGTAQTSFSKPFPNGPVQKAA
jgi:hypothetical protein